MRLSPRLAVPIAALLLAIAAAPGDDDGWVDLRAPVASAPD